MNLILKLFCALLFFIQFYQNDAKIVVSDKEYVSMPALFHLDDFDRCLLYEENNGLFCTISFQLDPIDPKNPSTIWKTIEKVSSEPTNYRHDLLRHGVCIPESCPNTTTSINDPQLGEKLTKCYNAKYKHIGVQGKVVNMQCQDKNFSYPVDIYHKIFAGVMLVFVAFVLFATFYEGVARYETAEEYERITGTVSGRIISAFSITKNWIRLKTVDNTNPEVNTFRFIQGIRFYNMILVILTHTVMINMAGPVSNTIFVETASEKFFNIFLSSGGFAMQTSFVLSTLLLTYNFLKMFEGKKDVSYSFILVALLHRIIRLTPALIVVWAYHSTWMVNAANGPYWDLLVAQDYRRCRANGWSNLIYINNYINQTEMCMPQTWYMACDTQFFVVALLLLKYIKKNEKRIYWVVAAILAIQVPLLFTIFYANNWEATMRGLPEYMYALRMIDIRQWHIILSSNYANLSGLAGGLLLGYIFYKYRNKKVFTTKTQVTIWWILTWTAGLGIIIVPGTIMYSKDYQHNRLYAALYGSTCKIVFIFGVGLGMFGFSKGIGWCAKWSLEWAPTYILGRLTYGAYIVHLTFQRIKHGSRRFPTYLSDFAMIEDLMADLVIAYLGGFFITLLFEMPITELLKIIMPSGEKKTKSEEKNKNK